MSRSDDLQPWERQPGESGRAYTAFVAYRDTPAHARTYSQAGQVVGANRNQSSIWAGRWGWEVRAVAYDRQREREDRAVAEEARRDMLARHARLAVAMQGKLVERLRSLEADKLSPKDIAVWLDVAARIERLARGEPDRVEVAGPGGGPVRVELSAEDRRARLAELRAELDRRLAGV